MRITMLCSARDNIRGQRNHHLKNSRATFLQCTKPTLLEELRVVLLDPRVAGREGEPLGPGVPESPPLGTLFLHKATPTPIRPHFPIPSQSHSLMTKHFSL